MSDELNHSGDTPDSRITDLASRLPPEVERRAPSDAMLFLREETDAVIAKALTMINPSLAMKILHRFPEDRQQAILPQTPSQWREQWERALPYPEGSIGRLMDPTIAVFGPDMTVHETIDEIRNLVKTDLITYGYLTDQKGTLLGLLAMRDLLLADPKHRLGELMLTNPFSLKPDMTIGEGILEVVHRHYPVYPVCDESHRLVGLVRGYALFEEHTIQITTQAGRMAGVEDEERLATSWKRSLKFRQPWLQLNHITAFVAAFVVGLFEHTIDKVVALAVFLPVLAGQSGNTGCQALAVTLRGLTLGELLEGKTKGLVTKKAWLGLLNGLLVGLTAGFAMYLYARGVSHPSALALGMVVFLAMTGCCVVSGVWGALAPLGLKKIGADPATASSIFLTTATDVASMGLFLGLATIFVL